jgi:putative RNA 2'-phosphotransferase
MKKQSKFLSFALRHNPGEAGLVLDANGWAETSRVVQILRTRFGQFNHDDLETLVRENDKQRFTLEGTRIRANQGHSIAIDLELEEKTPPAQLLHGTKQSFMRSIMRDGLVPGARQHVHLSADIETARIVANRRPGDSIILVVETAGLGPFYQSATGVWLTAAVPVSALSVRHQD